MLKNNIEMLNVSRCDMTINEINFLKKDSYKNMDLFVHSLMRVFKILICRNKKITLFQKFIKFNICYIEKFVNIGKEKIGLGFYYKSWNEGKIGFFQEKFNPIYESQLGKSKRVKNFINFRIKNNFLTLYYFCKNEDNKTNFKKISINIYKMNDHITLIYLKNFINEAYCNYFIKKNIVNTIELENYYNDVIKIKRQSFYEKVKLIKNSKKRLSNRLLILKENNKDLPMYIKLFSPLYIYKLIKLNILIILKEIKILFI